MDIVVTDMGLFEVWGNRFVLRECFAPYSVEDIVLNTDAEIVDQSQGV